MDVIFLAMLKKGGASHSGEDGFKDKICKSEKWEETLTVRLVNPPKSIVWMILPLNNLRSMLC